MKSLTGYWAAAVLVIGMAPGPSMADIDVLMVYTPAAFAKADLHDILRVGEDAINAKIDFMIAEANLIFANSALSQRVRLVGRRMIDYEESGVMDDELKRLADIQATTIPGLWVPRGPDGHMDIVHEWRDEVGADLVTLIVDESNGGVPGKGAVPYKYAHFGDHIGFTVINLNGAGVNLLPATVGMVYTHEIGHNLGCHHSQGEAGTAQPDQVVEPYAFGHKFFTVSLPPIFVGTIMANPEPLSFSIPIRYFSNPDVSYWFTPTGWMGADDIGANNAKVIRQTAPLIEAYRDQVIPDNSIWVDIAYVGFEAGTFSQPYNSVQEGIDNVAPGGTIVFKEGSEDWTGTIDKAMTLTSGIGVMVIGRD